jgi:hypothetical protein
MKKSISLLSNLLVSSALFWGVPSVDANDLVLKVPATTDNYCHMKFPPMSEESLSWDRPVFAEGSPASIDFYGSCDYDPLGPDEIRAQKSILRDQHRDGD